MYSFNITILGEGHPLSPGWQGPGRYFNPPSPCGKGRTPTMAIFAACTFQSTLPVWEGTRWNPLWRLHAHDFNPPSPCGEGRADAERLAGVYDVSIHPPRVGRDTTRWSIRFPTSTFQSTLPVWGGTDKAAISIGHIEFQSTLPVWGGTYIDSELSDAILISIHPPRVGRDHATQFFFCVCHYFNPPSPCGEGPKSPCIWTML